MRVYGGNFHHNGKQVRGIVAGTQKQVAAATGLSLGYIREHWCETGNKVELSTAFSAPGVLFWCPLSYGEREYQRAQPAPAPEQAAPVAEGERDE